MDIKPFFFHSKQISTLKDRNALSRNAAELPVDAMLEEKIIAAMRTVYDPEIHVNVYDLGLIYNIAINNDEVTVEMTLTAPACPVAEILPAKVAEVIKQIDGVSDARIEMVWEPAWCQDSISDEAKLELGLF